jgi:hypothetical protein
MKMTQCLFGLPLTLGLVATLSYNTAQAKPAMRPPHVDINVIGDQSGRAAEYSVDANVQAYRAYIQAKPNERYKVQVINRSPYRAGIVLAVDGRNAISGERSNLANTERMYVLNPYETQTIEGWRTAQNRTNRFFFTTDKQSYAAAWGDKSAMGVIAVAAFAERPNPPVIATPTHRPPARPAPMARGGAAKAASAEAGTGFGESTYSPSSNTHFFPQKAPFSRQFLKYEWKQTLCDKKVIPANQCANQPTTPNRFWPDNNGYAPAPHR